MKPSIFGLLALSALASGIGFLQVGTAFENDKQPGVSSRHASIQAYPKAVISLKDKASGMIFYVETNGRQLVALDGDGAVAWSIDVFQEAKFETTRGASVVRDLKVVDGALAVTCARSHHVSVHLKTGETIFLGND